MTRFIDKINQPSNSTVSAKSLSFLLDYLKSAIPMNRRFIYSIIKNFLKNKKSYGIYELSPNIVIVICGAKQSSTYINIGYPFPIYTETYRLNFKFNAQRKLKINIYLRGEILRREQRRFIKNFFKKRYKNFQWYSIKKIRKFQKITNSLFKSRELQRKIVVYIDGYNFIGDSLVGLYFIQQFNNQYKFNKILVLSKAYRHLRYFFQSFPKNNKSFKQALKRANILIVSDLIDNHLIQTLELFKHINKLKLFIFMVSRNLIISINHNQCKIYHYYIPDVLLRNKNLEDYMNDCLKPFLKPSLIRVPQVEYFKSRQNVVPRIFINPFGSDKLKQLPEKLFLKILEFLYKQNNQVKIIVSRGLMIKTHKSWLKRVKRLLNQSNYQPLRKEVIFLSDNSLTDLAKKIKKLKINSALSTDTSISHLLSLMLVPNITIYNQEFWDHSSPQSLSAESPLGYGRYNLPQYISIFNQHSKLSQFAAVIAQGLLQLANGNDYFIENAKFKKIISFTNKIQACLNRTKNTSMSFKDHNNLYCEYISLKNDSLNTSLSWLFEIYNPDQLVANLDKKSLKIKHLLYSSWRNLPLYKYIKNDRLTGWR